MKDYEKMLGESAAFAIDRAAAGEAFDLVPVLLSVRQAAIEECAKVADSCRKAANDAGIKTSMHTCVPEHVKDHLAGATAMAERIAMEIRLI